MAGDRRCGGPVAFNVMQHRHAGQACEGSSVRASAWLQRLGYFIVVVACVLLLGVVDFLPVDFSFWLQGLWSRDSMPRYNRFVTAEESSAFEWSLLVLGIGIIATGWWLKSKQASR